MVETPRLAHLDSFTFWYLDDGGGGVLSMLNQATKDILPSHFVVGMSVFFQYANCVLVISTEIAFRSSGGSTNCEVVE